MEHLANYWWIYLFSTAILSFFGFFIFGRSAIKLNVMGIIVAWLISGLAIFPGVLAIIGVVAALVKYFKT